MRAEVIHDSPEGSFGSSLGAVQPVVRAALVFALLSLASAGARLATAPKVASRPEPQPPPASTIAPPELPDSLCPADTLPDQGICVPVPRNSDWGGESKEAERNSHRNREGIWTDYDQIARRPDRPARYRSYRYPVEPIPGRPLLLSGYDLQQPDEGQRRGPKLRSVGHGGIDLGQRRGAPVRLIPLEHQVGNAEVLYVGPLVGNSVVTLHTLLEAKSHREYLVVYGHLAGPAPGVSRGLAAPPNMLLGTVGDSDSPGAIHLHLEVRQVREGIEPHGLAPGELLDNARTVACDPRNVFPLLPMEPGL